MGKATKLSESVPNLTPFFLNNLDQPAPHRFYQFLEVEHVNIRPGLIYGRIQLLDGFELTTSTINLSNQSSPNVFDRVEVWRAGWPRENLDSVVRQPIMRIFRVVNRRIIVLEYPSRSAKVFTKGQKVRLQQLRIVRWVHSPCDCCQPSSVHAEAAPHHQRATPKSSLGED